MRRILPILIHPCHIAVHPAGWRRITQTLYLIAQELPQVVNPGKDHRETLQEQKQHSNEIITNILQK